MGGKGGGGDIQQPPPVDTDLIQMQQEQMAQMMQAMMMFAMQAQQLQQPPPPPAIQNAPQLNTLEKVDWAKRQEELRKKVAADFNKDKAAKTGLSDTVLTSPLLDDDDAKTTNKLG